MEEFVPEIKIGQRPFFTGKWIENTLRKALKSVQPLVAPCIISKSGYKCELMGAV